MGFTAYLAAGDLLLLGADVAAAARKRWRAVVWVSSLMVAGILVLGWLWITSPM